VKEGADFAPPCWCPVCGYRGSAWEDVELRPNRFQAIACPVCHCYPRERLTWLLLEARRRSLGVPRLAVLEIGGRRRFGDPARGAHDYRNADIVDTRAPVDFLIREGRIGCAPGAFDVVLLSYVLCEIPEAGQRAELLTEARRAAKATAVLVIHDDLQLDLKGPIRLGEGDFFHPIRFGRGLLDEIAAAGWAPSYLDAVSGAERAGPDDDPPIIAAASGAAEPVAWLSQIMTRGVGG